MATGFRGDTTFPDATGASGGTVSLRGERDAKGNGRVYRISYTVTGTSGRTCSGVTAVGVPARKGQAAVDDGDQSSWNSFTGALVQ